MLLDYSTALLQNKFKCVSNLFWDIFVSSDAKSWIYIQALLGRNAAWGRHWPRGQLKQVRIKDKKWHLCIHTLEFQISSNTAKI